ncbi:MAG: hypothetical protein ABIQ35_03650, partial [Verrucomicrobiota bacterium]
RARPRRDGVELQKTRLKTIGWKSVETVLIKAVTVKNARSKTMICPHCQNTVPEGFSGAHCPFCEKDLTAQRSSSIDGPMAKQHKFRWPYFFAVMLAPVLLTSLSALLSKDGSFAVGIAILGGSVSGIVGGAMLGREFGKTRALKITLSIVFAIIMIVVGVGMNCFGCLVSGYKIDMR